MLAADERGHAPELGRVSVGTSCVRFTRADDVDLEALGRLVRAAADVHVARARGGATGGSWMRSEREAPGRAACRRLLPSTRNVM